MALPLLLSVSFLILAMAYGFSSILLYATQSKMEPHLIPAKLPFVESTIGILLGKTEYLVKLKKKFPLPIFTLRLIGQKVYVVSAAQLIHLIQGKTHAATFVPNLLDFGILFSGMSQKAKAILKGGYNTGNQFTASVHKHLLWGPTLKVATRAAVEKLVKGMEADFVLPRHTGLLELIQHQLTLAMTGAVYGPANPFNDPEMEANWRVFVRGISHLVNSPFPRLTAPSAIRARAVITRGFQKYFEKDGHLQAFAMIPEMYNNNLALGVPSDEVAKMEIATSLAMLSSGSISSFWLLYHILSDQAILSACRNELLDLAVPGPSTSTAAAPSTKIIDTNLIKTKCPTIMAVFHETFRYYSSVVSVKQVARSTIIGDGSHALMKDALVMIPGRYVHHNTEIWGANAEVFDHTRFLTSAEAQKNLSSTVAFRPFGAGVTACPGRHFSTNVLLTLVAIILLRFDVEAVDSKGVEKGEAWIEPTTKNADMWNAMPKPDHDVQVHIKPRQDMKNVEFKFVWGNDSDE